MQQSSPSQVFATDDRTFDEKVLKSAKPVLVDFWAEWCAPCKAVSPAVEAVAAGYGERLDVATLDVDANPATLAAYGIRGIPTLMLFKDGEVRATHVGSLATSQLEAFLETHLGH
ncbi:MAG: thioredoxin [Rhodocyclales bacterium GT-UBC]|nr:MAG: thioredoxin [Rhodocyclales bacterium GT-UBC]